MKNLILTFAAVCVVVAAGCSQMQPTSPSSLSTVALKPTYWPPGPQGCTPGYWKNHTGNWPAPYTTNTLFSSIFANAFPNLTLLDVLKLKGNDDSVEALGRHTVAALLNSASGFGLDLGTLQWGFNNFYNTDQWEHVKDNFEEWNEAGCPL